MKKLTISEIAKRVAEKIPETTLETPATRDSYLKSPAARVADVAKFLKEDPELSCDFLMNVSAFDCLKWEENSSEIEVTYHFYSYKHRHEVTLKVRVPRIGGSVPTLSTLYGCANFQEREVFDHFGVVFSGHPDLRRILLPDDWVGHPLLKDYVEQEEYNGMATTRPSML